MWNMQGEPVNAGFDDSPRKRLKTHMPLFKGHMVHPDHQVTGTV
jgi:hypothetical protein